MNPDPPLPPGDSYPLAGVLRVFEDAQRRRVALGEQLRAVIQGRDTQWAVPPGGDAEAMLRAIADGTIEGPVPILARMYRGAIAEERESLKLVETAVRAHPAWPWLKDVRGIGPSLAGRLLARLDIGRATSPASFWAYCGLATVAAREWTCTRCRTTVRRPAHRPPSGGAPRCPRRGCGGTLHEMDPTARIAQPWRGAGGAPAFDRAAKQACYLIGVSFTRQGGRYKEYYKEVRAQLEAAHPDWPKARRYLTALRRTEKRFLADLWCAWREAEGLPIPGPHAGARDRRSHREMVG